MNFLVQDVRINFIVLKTRSERKSNEYLQRQPVSLHGQLYAFRKYISSEHLDEPWFGWEWVQVAGHHKSPALSVQHSSQTDLSSLPVHQNNKRFNLWTSETIFFLDLINPITYKYVVLLKHSFLLILFQSVTCELVIVPLTFDHLLNSSCWFVPLSYIFVYVTCLPIWKFTMFLVIQIHRKRKTSYKWIKSWK